MEVMGRYAILMVGEKEAAGPATLDEVRGEISRQLRERMAQRAVAERAKELRSKYPIEKFLDRVESIDLKTLAST